MKIKFSLIIVLLFSVYFIEAQTPITLTQADMPTPGFTQTIVKDTPTTSVNYGTAGANQVYDFSNLTNTFTEAVQYLAPTAQQLSYFPSATVAVTSDNVSFVFLDATATKFQAIGGEGIDYGLLVFTPFSPVEDIYHFPVQYLSSYASTWGFYQGFTGSQVNASSVDSVRAVYTDHFSVTVDGWGKVITPVGAYKGLRIKRVDTTVTNIDAYYGLFSPSWNNVSSTTDITTEYSYVAKETKGDLVSFDYDSAGNMKDAKYSLIPPAPPLPHWTSVNGSGGLVTFTDGTDGYPTQYHWSFGNGDTSNLASPTYTYTANGTYYVCETVYNAGGSNTYCDSVHVTSIGPGHLPPVANNDTASVVSPNSTTIHVTANDNSPSGDTFCVTSVYGSSFYSVLNCNNVSFTPSAGYTGYDTAYYIVCNTGQPTLCDTAMIVVDVTPVATNHLPPVAVNDTASVIQPSGAFINVTANDHSPTGDSFCIVRVYGSSYFSILNCNSLAFHPAPSLMGVVTAWYVVCNVYQPTLCDTGSVSVTIEQNPNLLPFPDFSLNQVVCEGLVGVNHSVSADSVVWNFHALANGAPYPDTSIYYANNVQYGRGSGGTDFQVCITTFNQYGSSIKCDTMFTICEGITEVQLSGIRMYPNPASSLLSIDLRNSTDAITKDYTAIEIYNAIGQKIITMNKPGHTDVIEVPVHDLPSGIFLATMVDGKGASYVLGRFSAVK